MSIVEKPKDYWPKVFDYAAFLMGPSKRLNGETAYWLAKRLVDRENELTPSPKES